MHVIVVGCGRVGIELAPNLERLGHDVTMVDKNPRAFSRLVDFGGRTVVGFGFDHETLRAAGIDQAGALAAVTSGDNSNIVIARVAREHFGLERVVARIQDPARAEIYERLGIMTVATVTWANDQFVRRMLPDTRRADWLDATGSVSLVERELPDAWAGKPLATLGAPGTISVAAVSRQGSAEVVRPDTIGQAGDRIHVMVAADAVDQLDELLGVGGSR